MSPEAQNERQLSNLLIFKEQSPCSLPLSVCTMALMAHQASMNARG